MMFWTPHSAACGVLRVNSIADIFYMTEVLANQPRPQRPAADHRHQRRRTRRSRDRRAAHRRRRAGRTLRPRRCEALNDVLPPHWSHNNPIDIIGDAGPERYAKAVEIAAKDPNTDGLLVIMTPQGMTDPAEIAEKLTRFAKLDRQADPGELDGRRRGSAARRS